MPELDMFLFRKKDLGQIASYIIDSDVWLAQLEKTSEEQALMVVLADQWLEVADEQTFTVIRRCHEDYKTLVMKRNGEVTPFMLYTWFLLRYLLEKLDESNPP